MSPRKLVPLTFLSVTSDADRLPKRAALIVLLSLLFFTAVALAQGTSYNSLVVFGDSLSDTGNDAHLTAAKYTIPIPGPAGNYTLGRFTDGLTDTLPAARTDSGVWVEQLAALLPTHPAVKDSLDGGLNFAYGFARTGSGQSLFSFGPLNAYFVYVDNVGQQITDYLANHPRIDSHTLFILWSGADDILNATTPTDVISAATHQATNIQRLIDAGATQFLIVNLPPLGDTPRLNTMPTVAAAANQASVLFNDTLSFYLDVLPWLNFGRHLHLARLDVHKLFASMLANPTAYGFNNVTSAAQGNVLVNPDTYLFWDDLHPTTQGHEVVALAALQVVAPSVCAQLAYMAGQPTCLTIP